MKTHFRKDGKLVLRQNFREKILDGHWNGFVKEKHKGHEVDVPIYKDIDEDFKGKVVKGQFYNNVIVEDGTVITFQEIWE